jgi:hypothetical protein
MNGYFVNGSLTNLIQGTIGFNQYQGSIILEPFEEGLPWMGEIVGLGEVVIGTDFNTSEAYLKNLLRGTGMFPIP